MPNFAPPSRQLVRQKALLEMLDLPKTSFERLRKTDPNFPKPIKSGKARQASAFYVFEEIQAWINSKIKERDAA
ncbi:helix-turn-helix transcriptional regulator [Pseudomonas sp. QE6]|uniref:helix-turn-helix transcriptional regulator n=1 Tax=Pseudomonas sp. QE6 TaxID=3242491 RepID=UPI003528BAB6